MPIHTLARLGRDESGAMAIVIGVMLLAMMGFIGLAIDTSAWYGEKRRVQNAADAAALAGAHELERLGRDDPMVLAAARTDAAALGYGDGRGTVAIRVLGKERVEATVSTPASLNFATVFLSTTPTISATATAAVPSGAPPCLTLLEPSAGKAIEITDGGRITAPNCLIQVNSTSGEAVSSNGGIVEAAEICVVGGVKGGIGGAAVVTTGCKPLADPLQTWSPPATPLLCQPKKVVKGKSVSVTPDCYLGLEVVDEGHARLEPGTYFIRGELKVKEATLSGVDVGIVLLGAAKITIEEDARVDLKAPRSGPMAGVIFTHEKLALEGVEHKILGEADIRYEGAIYLPKQDMRYDDESSTANIPPFTTFLVRRIKVKDDARLKLDNNFAGSDVPVVGKSGQGVKLVM